MREANRSSDVLARRRVDAAAWVEQLRNELGAAFARVANGDHGICRRCRRAIDPARLEARPGAALCIDCARLAS